MDFLHYLALRSYLNSWELYIIPEQRSIGAW